jgi:hypothetical protein
MGGALDESAPEWCGSAAHIAKNLACFGGTRGQKSWIAFERKSEVVAPARSVAERYEDRSTVVSKERVARSESNCLLRVRPSLLVPPKAMESPGDSIGRANRRRAAVSVGCEH